MRTHLLKLPYEHEENKHQLKRSKRRVEHFINSPSQHKESLIQQAHDQCIKTSKIEYAVNGDIIGK